MSEVNFLEILRTNYPTKQWIITDNDYKTFEWFENEPKPSEKDLIAQWPDVEYQVAYNTVSISRQAAYSAPGGSDGIYFQWQRGDKTEQDWLDAVQAINDKYPYPVKEGK